jgi:hypothetical protein
MRKKEEKKPTLFKSLLLILLQGIALLYIYTSLSSTENFDELNIARLTLALAFILVSSFLTFNMLYHINKEEKENSIS